MAEKKAHAAGVYRDCNIVAQERVWKEAVHRETSAARHWYELCQAFTSVSMPFLISESPGKIDGALLRSMISR